MARALLLALLLAGCSDDSAGPRTDVFTGLRDFGQRDYPPRDSRPRFTDVPGLHPYADAIAWVVERGTMVGCGAETFCPDAALTREQAAASLIRMKLGEDFTYPTAPLFSDVPASSWSFRYVQKLAELQATAGCGGGNFCPTQETHREEAAALLVRLKFGDGFTCSSTPYFADVDSTSWAFKYVQKLHEEQISGGCGGANFCPTASISRGEWAGYLYRAKTL